MYLYHVVPLQLKLLGKGLAMGIQPPLYHCNPIVTLLTLLCRGGRQEKPLDFLIFWGSDKEPYICIFPQMI